MAFRIADLRRLIQEAYNNAYKILGVPPTASYDEIKAAYRKLMIANHPDRGGDLEKSKDANLAWTVLSDPEKRKKYDRIGDRTVDQRGETPPASKQQTPPPRSSYQPPPRPNPPPPPRDEPRPSGNQGTPGGNYQYYEFRGTTASGGKSSKFWWIKMLPDMKSFQTGWGRINSPGQTETFRFDDQWLAFRAFQRRVNEKINKGYKRVGQQNQGAPPKNPPPSPKDTPKKEPPKADTGKTPRTKKSAYKIYGKKGNSPVHTRFGGAVYTPSGGKTGFSPGNRANVGLGSDGRLSVNDPDSGRTQAWEKSNESLQRTLNDVVLHHLVETLLNRRK